jgi:hypothetical protein
MSRGGWKSVAIVVRYEHASEERDALLAQALNPFAQGSNVVPLASDSDGDRARSAHIDGGTEERGRARRVTGSDQRERRKMLRG